jgi:hypothetical protein
MNGQRVAQLKTEWCEGQAELATMKPVLQINTKLVGMARTKPWSNFTGTPD